MKRGAGSAIWQARLINRKGWSGGKARGDVYALVTDRTAEGTQNVFTYVAGYAYKPGSNATVIIDGKTFILFTKDDSAWAKKQELDDQIASALRKGTKLVVKGTSSRNSQTG